MDVEKTKTRKRQLNICDDSNVCDKMDDERVKRCSKRIMVKQQIVNKELTLIPLQGETDFKKGLRVVLLKDLTANPNIDYKEIQNIILIEDTGETLLKRNEVLSNINEIWYLLSSAKFKHITNADMYFIYELYFELEQLKALISILKKPKYNNSGGVNFEDCIINLSPLIELKAKSTSDELLLPRRISKIRAKNNLDQHEVLYEHAGIIVNGKRNQEFYEISDVKFSTSPEENTERVDIGVMEYGLSFDSSLTEFLEVLTSQEDKGKRMFIKNALETKLDLENLFADIKDLSLVDEQQGGNHSKPVKCTRVAFKLKNTTGRFAQMKL